MFVKVSVEARPTKVSLAVGIVKVVPSVPAKVSELLAVKVLPAAIFKVLVPLLVIVKPLTVVKLGVAEVAIVIVPVLLLVVLMLDPAAKVSVPP